MPQIVVGVKSNSGKDDMLNAGYEELAHEDPNPVDVQVFKEAAVLGGHDFRQDCRKRVLRGTLHGLQYRVADVPRADAVRTVHRGHHRLGMLRTILPKIGHGVTVGILYIKDKAHTGAAAGLHQQRDSPCAGVDITAQPVPDVNLGYSGRMGPVGVNQQDVIETVFVKLCDRIQRIAPVWYVLGRTQGRVVHLLGDDL